MSDTAQPSSHPSNEAAPWRLQVDSLVVSLALGAALLIIGIIWLRAHYPSAGFLAQPAAQGWQITSVERDASRGGLPSSWQGAQLLKVCSFNQPERCQTLEPNWMLDSPIALPSNSAMGRFIQEQQSLFAWASQPGQQLVFHARLPDQSLASAPATMENSREFINQRFVLILIAAVMVYTVGCAMLAFVRRTPDVWMVFAMCAGFFLFMLMRSWYTNRTWAQPEGAWWLAISLFRVGVITCGAAAVLALWQLRLKHRSIWLPAALCATLAGGVFLHALGVIDSAQWGYRIVTLGFLVLIIGIAASAWVLARQGSQGERLRSKNFGRLLLIGFFPLIVTMPIWTFRPDLEQIAYLQNMAVGLAGIPMVILVSQSTNYQLHVFWWRLWLVLVAAVMALVGSSLLVLLVAKITAGTSLALMVLFAGTAIYMLRNWLEKRLIGSPPALETFVAELMQMQGLQGPALDTAWQQLLGRAFAPQRIELASPQRIESVAQRPSNTAEITHSGDCLQVPALGSESSVLLTGASNFTRSFGFADAKLARSLLALAQQGLAARASFVEGAVQERRRIAADLHDDIGGKLLHLAGASGAEGQYARNTLEDLRTITRGLSAQPRALPELLADIQFQLGQRAERANIELDWQTDLLGNQLVIGSRQSTVLASICSELMRNAMQHAGVAHVSFVLRTSRDAFALHCSNDGQPTEPTQWKSGLGTTSIRRRVHDLQGQCDWLVRAGGGVSFAASWPLHTWLRGDTGAFQAQALSPSNFGSLS